MEEEGRTLLYGEAESDGRRRQLIIGTALLTVLVVSAVVAVIGLSIFFAVSNSESHSSSASPDDDDTPDVPEPKADTYAFASAAVASDNEQCSRVGAEILQKGGNAVDGAISTALCLGVLQQFASGIGGGGVAVIRFANGSVHHVDFREVAPAAATKDMYDGRPDSAIVGGLAVAVPGEVAGLEYLKLRFGSPTLPWSELVEPAKELAEYSEVGELLAARLMENKNFVLGFAGLRSVFAPDGKLLTEGEALRQPALAATLDAIAKNGAKAFYEGPVAEAIVNASVAAGGILTADDLKQYYESGVQAREALSWFYQGVQVIGSHPPFAGGVCMAQILNVLEMYNMPRLGSQSGVGAHWLVESMKLAFANRMAVGDPAFVANVDTEVVPAMMSKGHAAYLRQRLAENTTFAPPHYVDLTEELVAQIHDHGTSHISVVDEHGNAVALTTTVNTAFGSKILDERTGIVLNDEMADFSLPNISNVFGLPPGQANFVEPGKRPLSSMSPTIVLENGKLRMVVGGSGGPTIITATTQVLLNVIAYGMSVGDAITSARLHNQLTSDTRTEELYSPELVTALRNRRHVVEEKVSPIASVQSVVVEPDGSLTAASDWRKLGKPAGY